MSLKYFQDHSITEPNTTIIAISSAYESHFSPVIQANGMSMSEGTWSNDATNSGMN